MARYCTSKCKKMGYICCEDCSESCKDCVFIEDNVNKDYDITECPDIFLTKKEFILWLLTRR